MRRGKRDAERERALKAHLNAYLATVAYEENGRLDVFRQHLGERVRLASPLLLDACDAEDLDDAVEHLVPDAAWPDRLLVRISLPPNCAGISGRGRVYDVVNGKLSPTADRLCVRIEDRSVHMTLRFGAICLTTADWGGRLVLPGMRSIRERDEWVGARLDHVFQHPIVNHRQYSITSARQDAKCIKTVVEFAAPPVEWRVPWSRPPTVRR